ncbi:MAG: hypothetical protein IT370_09435 [Deltaproteobacteria bacterium]|nr:hypothetical protein [Deltaproteobacteria bacterium]
MADEKLPPDAPPPDDPPGDEGGKQRGRLEGFIPDLVKRTFYAGLGALFTTEEGIRKMANDFQLPKDVANYLIQQAAASKDELFRIVGRELRNALQQMDMAGELQKLLTAISFEIKTEIRFIPNDKSVLGVQPDMKNKVAVKKVGSES